jgi:hypothetical protein
VPADQVVVVEAPVTLRAGDRFAWSAKSNNLVAARTSTNPLGAVASWLESVRAPTLVTQSGSDSPPLGPMGNAWAS